MSEKHAPISAVLRSPIFGVKKDAPVSVVLHSGNFVPFKYEFASINIVASEFVSKISEVTVSAVEPDLVEIHVRASIYITGDKFESGLHCTANGETVAVQIITERKLKLTLPIIEMEQMLDLDFYYSDPANPLRLTNAVTVSARGIEIIKELFGSEALSENWGNPRNVYLALIAQELDRHAQKVDLALDEMNENAFTEATAQWYEEDYSLPVILTDPLSIRRARIKAAKRRQPRIDVAYLAGILESILGFSPVTFQEQADGPFLYQCEVYVPDDAVDPQFLFAHRTMEDIGPGHVRFLIGRVGFVMGKSILGRDFLGNEI